MGDISLRGSPHGGRNPGQCKTTHLTLGDWQKEEPQLHELQGQYFGLERLGICGERVVSSRVQESD